MKKTTLSVTLLQVLFLTIAILAISCKTTPVNPEVQEIERKVEVIEVNIPKMVSFTEVPDKEWKLIEVYVNERNSGFSRNSPASNVTQEIYTLSFDNEFVSGTGAPNRYSAPYTAGEDRTINIQLVRATLMAPIGELSNLREYEYFGYIQNAYKWNIVNDKLEINSKLENGSEIRLVFSL